MKPQGTYSENRLFSRVGNLLCVIKLNFTEVEVVEEVVEVIWEFYLGIELFEKKKFE